MPTYESALPATSSPSATGADPIDRCACRLRVVDPPPPGEPPGELPSLAGALDEEDEGAPDEGGTPGRRLKASVRGIVASSDWLVCGCNGALSSISCKNRAWPSARTFGFAYSRSCHNILPLSLIHI